MDDPSTRIDPAPPRPRRWPRRLANALFLSLCFVGPWPVDNSTFEGGEAQRRTLDRLESSPLLHSSGPILVGVAEVDITPGSPRPLAGFIGQIRTPFVGVDTRCYARALTVESASGPVTILTADLLLINARLAKAVVDRAGVRPDQVYFTSSHTHGGPGGWGDHPLEMLVAGAYDPGFFEMLADQLADVVKRSRVGLEPAEMGLIQVQAHDRQRNRIDPSLPTHDALSALVFRPLGASADSAPLAILAVFGAHATVSHPVPPRLGGDYPAALASELKRRTGARAVLFASGAVGDASPSRPKAASQRKSAEALGEALAGDLLAALPSARFARDLTVGNLRLDVDLPPVRLPFFAPWLRFSPFLTWWIADQKTHLHALRLGPAVLVGFPGDYSGHLADKLAESTQASGLSMIATSFDGDFRGYLVSEDVFRRRPSYETRWMSFYGPWAGEYFNDLARRMVDRLSATPIEARMTSISADFAPRIALAILLVAIACWSLFAPPLPPGEGPGVRDAASPVAQEMGSLERHSPDNAPHPGPLPEGEGGRKDLAKRRERGGRIAALIPLVITVAVLVAFVIDPELVAWGRFGLPTWLRMTGLPLGLVVSRRRGSIATGGMFVACGLLAASWIVVLMGLRWAISERFPKSQITPNSRLMSKLPADALGVAGKHGSRASCGPE